MTRAASSITAMALIEGSTPRRIRPQTSTGTLSSLPMLNQVTTNSSSDSAAASSAAPTSDGRISGRVMSRKARGGDAPRSRAASRTLKSKVSSRAFMVRITKGRQTRAWPMAALSRPGAMPRARKNTASAMPMTSSGTTAGSRPAGEQRRGGARALWSLTRPKAKAPPRIGRGQRRDEREDDAVPERRRHQRVGQRARVPVEGEALDRDREPRRGGEREQHDHHDRRVEIDEDEQREAAGRRSGGTGSPSRHPAQEPHDGEVDHHAR